MQQRVSRQPGSLQLAPPAPSEPDVQQGTPTPNVVAVSSTEEEVDASQLKNLFYTSATAVAEPDRAGASSSAFTLADLETMALESNPSLKQLAFVVEKARGIHEQVGLYPNPTVGYFGDEMRDTGSAGMHGGFISQTFVTANKLKLNRDVASWNVQELSWEYQAQRRRVLNDVRLRYYDLLGAQRRLSIADDLLNVAGQGAKIAEQLREAKQASQADVLQAEIDLNEIRIIKRNAEFELQATWKRLAAVLGRSDLPRREIAGALAGAESKRDWETLYGTLLQESPQLQAARSRVHGARMAICRQEVQPIPNILTQTRVGHHLEDGGTMAGVQIGVPLPLFNRNQGTLRVAHGEYQRAIRDAERLELQLRDRLATAYRNFQQAEYQVERYEQDILAKARENLKLTEEAYKGGQLSFLRVLTARRSYFEANLRYIESLIALRQAAVIVDGYVLTGGLAEVPDVGSGALNGLDQRGQTLSDQ